MYARTNVFVILIARMISASIIEKPYVKIYRTPKTSKIVAVTGNDITCRCDLVFDPNKVNSDKVRLLWKKNNRVMFSESGSGYKKERVMVNVKRSKNYVTSTLILLNATVERDSDHPWIDCYFHGTGFPTPKKRIRIHLVYAWKIQIPMGKHRAVYINDNAELSCKLIIDTCQEEPDEAIYAQWLMKSSDKLKDGLVVARNGRILNNRTMTASFARTANSVTTSLRLVPANVDPHSDRFVFSCLFANGVYNKLSEELVVDVIKKAPCGTRPLFPKIKSYRIYGGRTTSVGQVPWQVYLREKGSYSSPQCGGSVIHERWVLTAKHCLVALKPLIAKKELIVVTGITNRSDDNGINNGRVQTHTVERGVMTGFPDPHWENDIALLKLATPIRFDNFTQPVCLPQPDDIFVERTCSTSGWGLTEDILDKREKLKIVDLPIIANQLCQEKRRRFYSAYKITKDIMCTLYASGGRDACIGDSGGPLFCAMWSGQFVLAGVTSGGVICGDKKSPGLFVRVAMYSAWIRKMTGESFA